MADIKKTVTTKREFVQGREPARDLKQKLDRAETEVRAKAALTFLKKTHALNKPRYAEVIEKTDNLQAGFRGVVNFNGLNGSKDEVNAPGELTRVRGRIRRSVKVFNRGSPEDSPYLSKIERKGLTKSSSYQFDESGELISSVKKGNFGGSLEEWKRDEAGNLVRTKYSARKALFGRVSEDLSEPYVDMTSAKTFRTLTRKRPGRHETFKRDNNGELELISTKSFGRSTVTNKSNDGKFARTSVKRLGLFKETFNSLLDSTGKEIGRDVVEKKSPFSRVSAAFTDDGVLKGTSARFLSGLYARHTAYHLPDKGDAPQFKTVTRKLFGVTIGVSTIATTHEEVLAHDTRRTENETHTDHWRKTESDKPSVVKERDHERATSRATSRSSFGRSDTPRQSSTERAGAESSFHSFSASSRSSSLRAPVVTSLTAGGISSTSGGLGHIPRVPRNEIDEVSLPMRESVASSEVDPNSEGSMRVRDSAVDDKLQALFGTPVPGTSKSGEFHPGRSEPAMSTEDLQAIFGGRETDPIRSERPESVESGARAYDARPRLTARGR